MSTCTQFSGHVSTFAASEAHVSIQTQFYIHVSSSTYTCTRIPDDAIILLMTCKILLDYIASTGAAMESILSALLSPFSLLLSGSRTVLLPLRLFYHCCPDFLCRPEYISVPLLLFRLSHCIRLVSLAVSCFPRFCNRFYSSLHNPLQRTTH